MTNVLEYLERSTELFPEKIAFEDENTQATYGEVSRVAKRIGTAIARMSSSRKPVAVLMEKSVRTIEVFFGVVYGGCCYSLLDPKHPVERLNTILETMRPEVLVTDTEHEAFARSLGYYCLVVNFDRLTRGIPDHEALAAIRKQASSKDPLYINFTSGSTGVPKGVIVGHASVIEFIDSFTKICGISRFDVIGNQAPFDFDVSVKDIYSTISMGATMEIIPRKLFSIPTDLMDFLCDREVTTLIWAVSALCVITTFRGFKYRIPEKIRKVVFSGEVMPIKHLNIWRGNLPRATYFNVYGPTEITCNCTYYKIGKRFEPGDIIPIGQPFPGERVFLLDEEDNLIRPIDTGRQGEICVSGACLSLGYYNNPAQTAAAFVQNPLNNMYQETIYRTGDLAYYNEDGDLCFTTRKDFQIKHMGHRIELGEIEMALDKADGLNRCCVMYNEEKHKIYAFYEGTADTKELIESISKTLPGFMIPNVFRNIDNFPLTKNGKIDRELLKQEFFN